MYMYIYIDLSRLSVYRLSIYPLSITTANNLMRKKESTPWTISRTDYAIGEGQSTTLSPGITNVQYISS